MLKVAGEAPLPGQGEIIARPSPDPSASRISEADAMTKAPAMIAGQETADTTASIVVPASRATCWPRGSPIASSMSVLSSRGVSAR